MSNFYNQKYDRNVNCYKHLSNQINFAKALFVKTKIYNFQRCEISWRGTQQDFLQTVRFVFPNSIVTCLIEFDPFFATLICQPSTFKQPSGIATSHQGIIFWVTIILMIITEWDAFSCEQ